MFILGLTGGSGSGKSTVCEYLEKSGVYIIDTDKLARKVTEPKMPALSEIEQCFGSEVINRDFSLNRKKLAAIVFSDSDKLDMLNKITHKYITELIMDEIKKCGKDMICIDAPVLHAAGLENICDKTAAICADKQNRINRIMLRDNISAEDAKKRIDSQMTDSEYASVCDYVFYNNSEEDVETAARKILEIMCR